MKTKKSAHAVFILIAEEDKLLKSILQTSLAAAGFEVAVASDGVETLEYIQKKLPDLLLLDIVMPRKNGFDVLEELRLDPRTRNLPVVILSNLGQEEDVKRGLSLGAVDYLIKSNYSLTTVVEKVKKHARATRRQ